MTATANPVNPAVLIQNADDSAARNTGLISHASRIFRSWIWSINFSTLFRARVKRRKQSASALVCACRLELLIAVKAVRNPLTAVRQAASANNTPADGGPSQARRINITIPTTTVPIIHGNHPVSFPFIALHE